MYLSSCIEELFIRLNCPHSHTQDFSYPSGPSSLFSLVETIFRPFGFCAHRDAHLCQHTSCFFFLSLTVSSSPYKKMTSWHVGPYVIEGGMAAQANFVWEQGGIGQSRTLRKMGEERGRRTHGACCLETKHRLAQWCHPDRRGGGCRLKVVYKGKSKGCSRVRRDHGTASAHVKHKCVLLSIKQQALKALCCSPAVDHNAGSLGQNSRNSWNEIKSCSKRNPAVLLFLRLSQRGKSHWALI